jgi:hypothetical protein
MLWDESNNRYVIERRRTMDEKRKFERFNINVPARIEIITQEGQKEKYDLETCNLSAEGVYLKFGRPLLEGSQVNNEIFLTFEELKTPANPNGTLIIATTGRVLRSEPEGTAIRFNKDYDIMTCLDFIQKEK